MSAKLTRRSLAALAAPGALATQARLAAAQSPPAESPEQLLEAARDAVKRNREALRKFALPMATEPAFAFKA